MGIASNKFLAKLATEKAKPDGLFHLAVAEQLEFLHALAAEALWGVGPATLAGLKRLGVETVGDIAELPEQSIARVLGPTHGRQLHQLAMGIDERRVEPDGEAKSISVEETYDTDLSGSDVLETALLAHAQRLSWRLHSAGLRARTVTLKARYSDFTTITRSKSFGEPIDGARDLFRAAQPLLAQVDHRRPVRLLGLGGAGLETADAPRQLDLDGSAAWTRVEETVADVRERFGEGAVSPARLLGKGGTPT